MVVHKSRSLGAFNDSLVRWDGGKEIRDGPHCVHHSSVTIVFF